ncbi:hypothetical protein ACLOJK_015358 [Asimina triloba]
MSVLRFKILILVSAAPSEENNGFVYAKIFGGFDKIRSAICDLVTISRLLNATLVIPEIQESTRDKGISSKFRSFSYLYDEDQFIEALAKDVIVVKSLPKNLKDARKMKKILTFTPKNSASPAFYFREVLPNLKRAKVVGLMITGGGCLQFSVDVNCARSFSALQFASRHCTAEGCSFVPEAITYCCGSCNRLCFLPPYHYTYFVALVTTVGLLLRSIGYLPETIIYVTGSQTFGGQRVLIPLRAMFPNLTDRPSLCTKKELSDLVGLEVLLPLEVHWLSPPKSEKQLIEEWKKAGPRPRPLPPPPARPVYEHEKEGWYGWITETEKEPDPSPMDLRMQAHRLLWDALDYIVSVEADAFFPGFHNDGSRWPDLSSLIMGHRLYQMPSARTYRPDRDKARIVVRSDHDTYVYSPRTKPFSGSTNPNLDPSILDGMFDSLFPVCTRKFLARMFDEIRDNLYHPKHNWTVAVRDHLNRSLNVDGLAREAASKRSSFLSHPLPECTCRTAAMSSGTPGKLKGSKGELLYGDEDECPEWMKRSLEPHVLKSGTAEEESIEERDSQEEDVGMMDSEDGGGRADGAQSLSEQDEEMDPDD